MKDFSSWLAQLMGQETGQVDVLLRDRSATNFLITWSIYEAKCFDGFMKIGGLKTRAKNLVVKGFDVEPLRPFLLSFHSRYQKKSRVKNLFHGKSVDSHFEQCLAQEASTLPPEDVIFFLLVVVYRYRNNIFHGNKGVSSWLGYKPQIQQCIVIMQVFVNYQEAKQPTLVTPRHAA